VIGIGPMAELIKTVSAIRTTSEDIVSLGEMPDIFFFGRSHTSRCNKGSKL
jgi:hypothetical protein